MKKIFILLVLLPFCVSLFAQNFSLDGWYSFQIESLLEGMTIKDNTIILKYKNPPVDKPDLILKYKIKHIDGMAFIELSDKIPMEVANWKDFEQSDYIKTDNRILFLAFRTTNFLLKTFNVMFSYTKGFQGFPPDRYASLTVTKFEDSLTQFKGCSSYLTEKNKSYPVENLNKFGVDTPWVEGVKGDGIGEWFIVEKCSNYLLLINGYISYEKPYLYKQNNRIKQIKVTGIKSGKSKILDILDTPHPQTVDISFITDPEDIRVEIADVYKGTKYDDTCLHFCCAYDDEVIPYENSIDEFLSSDYFDK